MARAKDQATGQQVLKELKSKKGTSVAPLYYLYGDDPYQVRELVEYLVGLVQSAFRDFNLHQVTGGEASGEQIAGMAQQLPVMDERCVILVREASQLSKSDWDGLQAYLEDPSPTTCLVFVDSSNDASLDGRTKVGKILRSAAVACQKPYENKIPQWLQDRAKEYHLRLHRHAIERLMDLLGTELSALDNALQRLSLYLGGAGDVSVDLVNEVISADRNYNVFELVSFVGSRQFEKALRFLRGAMQKGEAPLKLLTMLAKMFRELLQARVLWDQGQQSISAYDRFINPKLQYKREERIREFMGQVRCFSRKELIKVMRLMHETDLALKSTSGLTPDMLMERLLFEMCLPLPPTSSK